MQRGNSKYGSRCRWPRSGPWAWDSADGQAEHLKGYEPWAYKPGLGQGFMKEKGFVKVGTRIHLLELQRFFPSSPYGSFRKLGVPYFGVLIIRILLFRVLY